MYIRVLPLRYILYPWRLQAEKGCSKWHTQKYIYKYNHLQFKGLLLCQQVMYKNLNVFKSWLHFCVTTGFYGSNRKYSLFTFLYVNKYTFSFSILLSFLYFLSLFLLFSLLFSFNFILLFYFIDIKLQVYTISGKMATCYVWRCEISCDRNRCWWLRHLS